jgi:hypothetical protein
MTEIHMQTEAVQEMINIISNQVVEMSGSQAQLRNNASGLSLKWTGGKSSEIIDTLQRISSNLSKDLDNLQNLAGKASGEVNQWIEADARFGDQLSFGPNSSQTANPQISEIGAFVATGAGAVACTGLDWGEWARDEFDSTVDVDSGIVSLVKDQADELVAGEVKINGLADAADIKEAGDLGKLDAAFTVGGAGISIAEKVLIDHKSLGNAALGTGVSTGVDLLMGSLIPGFGEVMLISAGVQLLGQWGVGLLESSGNHQAAALLHDTLDVIDLGGYVDDIGNGIADWVTNPQHPNPLTQVGDRLSEVGKIADDLVPPVESAAGGGGGGGAW